MSNFAIPDLNITEWEEYVRLYGNNINSMYSFGYNKGFSHGYAAATRANDLSIMADNNMMPLLTMDDLQGSPTSVNDIGYYSNGGNKSRIKRKNNKKKKNKTRRLRIKN